MKWMATVNAVPALGISHVSIKGASARQVRVVEQRPSVNAAPQAHNCGDRGCQLRGSAFRGTHPSSFNAWSRVPRSKQLLGNSFDASARNLIYPMGQH
jgi:hypothetical protein